MRTLLQLQEDLSPQIGHPGGPCQTIRRIEASRLPAPQKQKYIDTIEDGDDLPNTDASKIYKPITETLPGNLPYKEFQLSAHAQYRMDLRGIAVPQMRAALTAFIKHVLDMKSQRHPTYERWISQETSRSRDTIVWTDPRLGLSIVLAPTLLTKSLTVVTAYWQNMAEEPAPGDDGCALWTPEYDRPAPRPVEESKKSISRRSARSPSTLIESQQFTDEQVMAHIWSMTFGFPGLPIWIFLLAEEYDGIYTGGLISMKSEGFHTAGQRTKPLDLLYGKGFDPRGRSFRNEAEEAARFANLRYENAFLASAEARQARLKYPRELFGPRPLAVMAQWAKNTPEGRATSADLADANASFADAKANGADQKKRLIESGKKALELLTAAWRKAAPEEYEATKKAWLAEKGERGKAFTHYTRD